MTGGAAFYYRPGSTFKMFVAAAAIDLGVTGERFTCRAEGFTPEGSGRPIKTMEARCTARSAFTMRFGSPAINTSRNWV